MKVKIKSEIGKVAYGRTDQNEKDIGVHHINDVIFCKYSDNTENLKI